LLLVLISIVLILVGFFVIFLWSIYQAYREASESVEEIQRETKSEIESEEKRHRKSAMFMLIGPIPIVVRSEKVALVLTVLLFAVFLIFVVLSFIWLLNLV